MAGQISLQAGICIFVLFVLAGCVTPLDGLRKVQFKNRVEEIELNLGKNDSNGVKLVKSTPKFFDAQFEPWFKQNVHRFPPEYLYAMAARYQKFGDFQEAGFWYLVGRSRYLYDLFRCTDKSVQERLYLIAQSVAPTITYLKDNPKVAGEVGQRALAWDTSAPLHTVSPLRTCLMGTRGWAQADFSKARRAKSSAGYVGGNVYTVPSPTVENPGDWVVPESEFPRIRKETLDIMKEAVARLANPKKN